MTGNSHQNQDERKVVVIIPALNEEEAIGKVLDDIPWGLVDELIVVDNGSEDNTAAEARKHGAVVVREERKGYGHACLAGLDFLSSLPEHASSIVVFMDGDHSDHPEEMGALLKPIIQDGYDLVIGSRLLKKNKNAIPFHAALANSFIGVLLTRFLSQRVTDLGPFRAVRYQALRSLEMEEKRYGWTVEMIIKAVRRDLKVKEIPVSYRKRVGTSKVSGNPVESCKAMVRILLCMVKYLWS